MTSNKIATSSYKKLVSDISSLYEGARKALVEAYWKIGQRIVEVEQKGEIKAAYGAGLIQKLSGDLARQCGPGFSLSNLKRMRQFYLFHPKSPPAGELSWSQYTELLPIGDAAKRKQLIQKVVREDLDSKDIRELVRQEIVREEVAENISGNGGRETEPPELLLPVRGMLYTYRIIQPKLVGKENSELLMDLGFSCTKDVEDVTSHGLKPGDIVTSAKSGVRGTEYGVSRTEGSVSHSEDAVRLTPYDMLYTYRAEVEKVVDGDTLRVIVDLGFGFKTRQYLRLRGLNCPETDTEEGKKAAAFVRNKIKIADKIILTSSKSDKYDRYLADIFYMDKEGKEIFLNNLLLESGYAVRVEK